MIYNPIDRFYKNPIGAVKFGQPITFRVKGNFNSVIFVCHKDGEDLERRFNAVKIENYFEVTISLEVGLYWYKFDIYHNTNGCEDNSGRGRRHAVCSYLFKNKEYMDLCYGSCII